MTTRGGVKGKIRVGLDKSEARAYMAGMLEQRPLGGLAFMKMHGLGNDFVIIDSRGRGAMVDGWAGAGAGRPEPGGRV